jgi:hypothetical protein
MSKEIAQQERFDKLLREDIERSRFDRRERFQMEKEKEEIAFEREELRKNNEHARDMARRNDKFRTINELYSFQYNMSLLPTAYSESTYSKYSTIKNIPSVSKNEINTDKGQLMDQVRARILKLQEEEEGGGEEEEKEE